MTVLYFARMVPAYRVPVLEGLNERLGGGLVVCSGDPPGGSSLSALVGDSPPEYRTVTLRNRWLGGEWLHVQPFGRAFRAYPQPAALLIEESPRSITLPLLLRHARKRGIGTALWGHFSSNDRPFRPDTSRADRHRRSMARSADACIAYSEAIADLLRPHLPANRLFVAPNTLDMARLDALRRELSGEGRAAVRERLGLEGPVLVFLGRLKDAATATLLRDVMAHLEDATLLVIGDGAGLENLQAPNIRLLGPMRDFATSAPYLFAADALLHPGPLGLAVNHAFAFGLPVISRAAPPDIRFHGPEATFVHHGTNGLFAEASGLADAARTVLADLDRFRAAALKTASLLSLERMVDGLETGIRFAASRST